MARPVLRVILVRPRDPNNIGACARALANFGLSDLWVVAPYAPVWREARSAVGAEPLLRRAREAASISEALRGCGTVLGTSSLQRRRPGLPVTVLPDWRPAPGRTAILFGPEKTGLTAEHLAYCSGLLRIPSAAACPSLNLAAAVAVVCYRWAAGRTVATLPQGPAPAAGELKERLVDELEALADRCGVRAGQPRDVRRRALEAAVRRSNVSADEAGLALELARKARRLSATSG